MVRHHSCAGVVFEHRISDDQYSAAAAPAKNASSALFLTNTSCGIDEPKAGTLGLPFDGNAPTVGQPALKYTKWAGLTQMLPASAPGRAPSDRAGSKAIGGVPGWKLLEMTLKNELDDRGFLARERSGHHRNSKITDGILDEKSDTLNSIAKIAEQERVISVDKRGVQQSSMPSVVALAATDVASSSGYLVEGAAFTSQSSELTSKGGVGGAVDSRRAIATPATDRYSVPSTAPSKHETERLQDLMSLAAGSDEPVVIESALRLGQAALQRCTATEFSSSRASIDRLCRQLARRLPTNGSMSFGGYGEYLHNAQSFDCWSETAKTFNYYGAQQEMHLQHPRNRC
eukprot:SAG31_NODE_1773_length_7304_cov_2.180380_5_plen_344_part_00